MSVDELNDSVPETELEGSDGHAFVILLDQHIPHSESPTSGQKLQRALCYCCLTVQGYRLAVRTRVAFSGSRRR